MNRGTGRISEQRLRTAYDKLGYWTSGDQSIKRWHFIATNQAYEFTGPRLPVLRFEKFPNLKNVESIGCDQLGPLVSDRTRDVSQGSRVASELLFVEDGRSKFQALVRTSVYLHRSHRYSTGCSK